MSLRKLTYEDYVSFPDDGRRWELIDGEAFAIPSPGTRHQTIVGRLLSVVADGVDAFGGGRMFVGPLDVLLSDVDVVQPDVIFVSDDDEAAIEEPYIRGAPAWLIEVVSDPVRDKKVKRDLYMSYGVREYWTVEPLLRRIEIHRPGAAPVILESPAEATPSVLPGLAIRTERLFAD